MGRSPNDYGFAMPALDGHQWLEVAALTDERLEISIVAGDGDEVHATVQVRRGAFEGGLGSIYGTRDGEVA